MKTRFIRCAFLLAAFGLVLQTHGQVTFQNLDFESPVLPLVPSGQFGVVPISNALPHWTGYLGPVQQTLVLYNNRFGGTATLGLLGPGQQVGVILDGQYTALLQPGVSGQIPARVDAAIAQTGMIPLGAQSLRFLAFGPEIVVTFSGQSLSLSPLMSGPNFGTLFGADISIFAGQTGELRFIAPDLPGIPNDVFLDNIFFSPQSVPEPSAFGLFALGSLLLGWRFWKR